MKGCLAMTSRIKVNYKEVISIAEITENQKNQLKHNLHVGLEDNKGNKFFVEPENVYCFGDIDFKDGSDDLKTLDTFNWLDDYTLRGVIIPADYDYETHTCYSPIKYYRNTETTKPSKLCQYFHGLLKKPKYVIIFKQEVHGRI